MIEVLKQMLEALEWCHGGEPVGTADAIQAGKKLIAELESQEPVAWRTFDGEGQYEYRAYEENENYANNWNKRNPNHAGWVHKLYTHSQRTWVDLTRTQIQDVYFAVLEEHRGGHQMQGQLAFGEALQAKLKERNT